jgi:hypothetical protein
LTADQKRLYAHMMEVYAGALSHADYQIGRVIDAVRESGQLDNTIIIYEMGDNGASAEGTMQGTTNEVATAANGVTETIPYLMSIAPTRHNIQYFELVANRAIYKDGWMASTTPQRLPWATMGSEPSPEDFPWELYNIDKDPSQASNLAAQYPDKLKELQAAFDVEAKKYNVYPLDSSFASRADPAIRPSLTAGRNIFTYSQGQLRIPEGSAPNFKNQSWVIDADVTIPQGGATGVIATIGGNFGGWSLFVMNNKPEFAYAYSNQPQHKYRIIRTSRDSTVI